MGTEVVSQPLLAWNDQRVDHALLQAFKENLPAVLKEPTALDNAVRAAVVKSLKEYRHTYDAVHRDEAREILQANQVAVRKQFELKKARADATPTIDILSCEGAKNARAEPAVVRMLGKTSGKYTEKATAPAFRIPPGDQLPKCTAWTLSRLCSKARDTTKRMFYTDDDGETIPANEDEDDERAVEFEPEGIFGRHQQRDEWILHNLFVQFSFHPQALLALVTVFKWQWAWLVRYIADSPHLLEMLLRQRLHELGAAERRAELQAKDPARAAPDAGTSAAASQHNPAVRTSVPPCTLPASLRSPASAPPAPAPAANPSTSAESAAADVDMETADPAGAAEPVGPPLSAAPEGGPVKPRSLPAADEGGWDLVKGCLDMYCQYCKLYNCRRHGPKQVMHDRKPYPISKSDALYHENSTESCGPDCFRSPAPADAPTASDDWTRAEEDMLAQGRAIFRDIPCSLALFVGTKTCAQVQRRLQRDAGALAAPCDAAGLPLTAAPARRKRAEKSSKVSVVAKRAPAIATRLKHDPSALWPEYTPCTCEGEAACHHNCPCSLSKNFCEKYCKCGGKCVNAHKGCCCTTSCNVSSCPCLASGRECDPDKCRGCTPTALGTVQPGGRVCHNMNLRLGVRRQVAMGLSEVAGWGCFILEDTKQHDFIGEYTGDLVTQDEAERRGKVYDIMDSSYLFSLNEGWAIDAQKHGNKLRYANHSQQKNAYARILMVDGDHRVGIFADKDMKAGVEIFYDYGYDDCYCPDWGEKEESPRGESSRRRKGIPIKRTPS